MVKFYMATGLPGSGKSSVIKDGTFLIEKYMYEYTMHISSDAIRLELFGDESHQGDNTLVFEQMLSRTIAHLKAGHNVYYDATNLSRKRRVSTLDLIKRAVNDVHCVSVVFAAPLNTCIVDDKNRQRTVGEDVIIRMAKAFQMPMVEEGFDEVDILPRELSKSYKFKNSYADAREFLDEFLYGVAGATWISANYDQNNPNHTLLLHEHIYKAYQNATTPIVKIAAGLHDIGKPFCREEKDGRSIYYGHDSVSAYLALVVVAHLDIEDEYLNELIYDVPVLVNFHMQAHQVFSEKASAKSIKKLKDFLGEELFEDLKELHKADTAAK